MARKNLTEKQKLFLDFLFDEAEGDIRTASRLAGYSEGTRPQEVAEALKDEIFDLTKTYLSSNGPIAAFSVRQIIDEPKALGNREKLAAAKDILDRTGHKPKEQVEIEAESPLFILPAKDKEDG